MTTHGDQAESPLPASIRTGARRNSCHEPSQPARLVSPAAHRGARPSWASLPAVASGASRRTRAALLFSAILLICLAGAVSAGAAAAATPEAVDVEPVELLTDAELQTLVAPVALYPDDLLAIVLPASTFPLQVVMAARFLEARETDPSLEPDEEWDASIVALLNYPEVVALLDGDLGWTWQLGEAVFVQEQDVIAAIAEFRRLASAAGNLESDDKQVVSVSEAGAIEITPVEREVIYVPYYDPAEVVTYQPRRVYYYHPRAYPVYYYPYPSGHYFSNGWFWGVSSAFSIGWHSRSLHWHHRGFHDHPYFGYSYYDPFYYRRPHIWLSFYRQDRLRRHDRRHHDDNRWHNDDRRGGSRPGRRPDRRGGDNRPGGAGDRAPGGPDQAIPPRVTDERGIERNVVAMPSKRSSHIPAKRNGQRAASPVRRTEPAGARPAGTRSVASASRAQTPDVPPSRQRGSTVRPSTAVEATVPNNAAIANGRRSIGQQRAASRSQGTAPRVATPIRRPAKLQRPAVSPRPTAREQSPRMTRPVPVRKPEQSAPPRVQQSQKPSASSLGARAASAVRGSRTVSTGRAPVPRAQRRAGSQSLPAMQTRNSRTQVTAPPPRSRPAATTPRVRAPSAAAPRSFVKPQTVRSPARAAPAPVRAPARRSVQRAAPRPVQAKAARSVEQRPPRRSDQPKP